VRTFVVCAAALSTVLAVAPRNVSSQVGEMRTIWCVHRAWLLGTEPGLLS